LTFFFTGVPPLEEEGSGKEKKAEAVNQENKMARMRKKKNSSLKQQLKVFMHGPYGVGECYHCHDTAGSKGFRTVKGKRPTVLPRNVGIGGKGRLRAPVEEICLPCHTYKTSSFANARGMWLHGPVSQGKCIWCHNPHRTAYRYMLLKKTSRELCQQCHEERILQMTPAHQDNPEKECISCHNPHLGKTRFLLKADYDELF